MLAREIVHSNTGKPGKLDFLKEMRFFNYLPDKLQEAIKKEDATLIPKKLDGKKFTLHSEEIIPSYEYRFVLVKD